MTVYVVVAVSAEVPVAVMVLAPPVVSATTVETAIVHPPAAVEPEPPGVVPVVQEKEVVVHIAVVTDTESAEPKPLRVRVPVMACSGKPKLLVNDVALNETFGVMENGVLTVLVPSDTTMV